MRPGLATLAGFMLSTAGLLAQQPAAPQPVLPDATVDKLLKADPATRQRGIALARQALEGLQKADALLAQTQQQSLNITGETAARELAKPVTGTESGSPQAIADKGSQVINQASAQRWQIGQQIKQLTSAIAKLENAAGGNPKSTK